jgi:hypothetical protein
MRAALVAVMCAGCRFEALGFGAGSGDPSGDGAQSDATACTSFSSVLDTCSNPPGADQDLMIAGTATYDTDTSTLTIEGGATTTLPRIVAHTATGDVDVLVAHDVIVSGPLRVTGTFAFAIVAYGDVAIAGDIDMSEGAAGERSGQTCGAALGLVGDARTTGGGGGGGGAFQGAGGAGSQGDHDQGPSNGGPGGKADPIPMGLLGGCPGGFGGAGMAAGGKGGQGGGAIAIAARGTISIDAVIDAGGGGGNGGTTKDGAGGGGGSGGMILLEAATLANRGTLAANGGGGGEGGDGGNTGDGGTDATTTTTPAGGGVGNANDGTDGGVGGAGAALDGGVSPTPVKNGGGGGGGGGVGYIAIASRTTITSAGTITPAHIPWP